MAPAFKENTGWQVAQPADTRLRGEWWTIFGDEQLNKLEPLVATSNQSAKAAEARFREARSQIQFNRSNLAAHPGRRPQRRRPARLLQPALLQRHQRKRTTATASASSASPSTSTTRSICGAASAVV